MASIQLIAGLGNPGRKHERDRHNAGFRFLSRLAEDLRVEFKPVAKYHALLTRLAKSDGELWLVMPQTYMNLSGQSVGALARFYKIHPAEVLVVHDELDFEPGVAKLKFGGGVAGHNGLKDIAEQLGSRDFWRMRIGIGHPGDRDRVADYVLSPPPAHERELIDAALDKCLAVLPVIRSGDMAAAMLKLHTKE